MEATTEDTRRPDGAGNATARSGRAGQHARVAVTKTSEGRGRGHGSAFVVAMPPRALTKGDCGSRALSGVDVPASSMFVRAQGFEKLRGFALQCRRQGRLDEAREWARRAREWWADVLALVAKHSAQGGEGVAA